MNYSKNLAEKISEIGVELYGKSDKRFIEAMYKVCGLIQIFVNFKALDNDKSLYTDMWEQK